MSLTERKVVDLIEVLETNKIQIRTANIIERDGKEITRTFSRHFISPGDDIGNEDIKVQKIANAIW